MDKVTSILIVGVGGQGTILASDILTSAALGAGLDAKKSEIHGMSQRGGSVFSHVRFGARVHSPVIPAGQADVLVALEEMEALRWLPFCHAGTRLVAASTRILPAGVETYPEGCEAALRGVFDNALFLDAAGLTARIGNPKFLNVAVCGAVAPALPIPDGAWRDAIDSLVPAGTFEGNWAAFEAGRELGKGRP